MAGYFMSKGDIDAVVVGADRVARNGDVANKIGTYMVAVLAKQHGIPFYVACPLSTVDTSTGTGEQIVIEERAVEEVIGYRGVCWAPSGIQVRNPAFDITPASLVTALITEKGVIRNPGVDSIAAILTNP
jgi:methylthioribose-1-phosphate isomerase